MPMIGHNTIGKDAHILPFLPFCEYLFKLLVFLVCIEHMHTGICAIDYMIYNFSHVCA